MGTSSRQPNPMTMSCRRWVLIFQPGPLWKVLMPTNYGAASRHQWVGVWITPGLLLDPLISRTRVPHKIHLQRAESIISEGGVITEMTHVWLVVSWSSESGSVHFYCRWSWSRESGTVHLGLDMMPQHVERTNIQNKAKFVFHIRSRSGLNYKENLTITKYKFKSNPSRQIVYF